jgi:SIR2-like domain/TIR domain
MSKVTGSQSGPVSDRQPTMGGHVVARKVFINYRHEDTEEAAVRLYERLETHFGAENVFLDIKTLEAGSKWLEEIKERGAHGSAFLALIGHTWLASLKEREQQTAAQPEDYVSLELELALGHWPGKVIPVLVGRATMPEAVRLPKPIRALAGIQAMPLRPLSFDEDAGQLIAKIDALEHDHDGDGDLGTEAQPLTNAKSNPDGDGGGTGGSKDNKRTERNPPAIAGPDSAHYESVLRYMIQQGSVVPVLGSGVRGSLPDAKQLAAHLAQMFGLRSESLDLAEVAQRVSVAEGPSFLDRAMVAALTPQPEPNDTHRFLARFPTRLKQLGFSERYQMLVTTNYDSALEQAFEAEGEPYDLAVFLANGTDASGTDQGKFIHVPWRGEPRVIHETTKYRDFPIDRFDELERTVIVKINGAAEGGEGDYRWDGSYVLTEDQYIDYLVTDQIVRVIPNQILNKLTGSHCLFLGYAMHDWSLRVFLKRIWQGRPLKNRSWAIEREPDDLEKDSWSSLQVELLASSPDDYANELNAHMTTWRANGA